MEGNGREANENLIARKRSRKGTPRKLVLPHNKILSISEPTSHSPNDYFSNQGTCQILLLAKQHFPR